MSVLRACICVQHVCVVCPRGQKSALESLQLRVTMWVLGTKQDPLQEQQKLLTMEPGPVCFLSETGSPVAQASRE